MISCLKTFSDNKIDKIKHVDMNPAIYSIITGTGSYIPSMNIRNRDFLPIEFYDSGGKKLEKTSHEIIDKFQEITTIKERRYVSGCHGCHRISRR
jgi:uncharacterized protein (DUF2225 family)